MLLFVTIPLFCTIGFLIKQQLVIHSLHEKLEQGLAKTYSFSKHEILWVTEGEELLVKGKLFDVHSYKITNNSIIVTGLFDYEEELLTTGYLQISSQNKHTPSPFQLFLLKTFFSPLYYKATKPAFTTLEYTIIPRHILRRFEENIVPKYYPVISPPPKTIG